MKKITIVLAIFFSCTIGLLYAQNDEKKASIAREMAKGQAQIDQIRLDEATLNSQCQSAYADKESQINTIMTDMVPFLNKTENLDTQGTINDSSMVITNSAT